MFATNLEHVHHDLVQSLHVAPVGLDDDEQRAWLDCDLASLAEHRLGDLTDPRSLDAARRADWIARATKERATLPKSRWYQASFWLLDGGERVGTVALSPPLGGSSAHLSSYYVFPNLRGKGLGSRKLLRLLEVLVKHGLGMRLETAWTWQRSVEFYRRLGFWVYMWKRNVDLIWVPSLPLPCIEVGADEASLSVSLDGSQVVLARARRHGDKLEFDEGPTGLMNDERIGEAYLRASSTLALAIAMKGWPLVRSPEEWAGSYYADAGPPEALAYKITLWEAEERSHGWIVNTPRIPGLEYPTWDEFEARWAKEEEQYAAKKNG